MSVIARAEGQTGFQFHKGTIKTLALSQLLFALSHISIP